MSRKTGQLMMAMWIGPGMTTEVGLADCALLHHSFENLASIQAAGGVVFGTLDFVPGANGQAAQFTGDRVIQVNSVFNAPRGSVAFWFKKSSPDLESGILQIGALGQPNSKGLFYTGGSDLVFEARNAAGALAQVHAPGVLSTTAWRHVTAAWGDRPGGLDLWLFIDGRFVEYTFLQGAFVHSAGQMQIGTAGTLGLMEGRLDEFRFFDWSLLDGEVYAEYVFSADRFVHQASSKPISTGPVRVVGKSLTVNGRPFLVQGVGYQPTPIGMSPTDASVLNFLYTNSGIRSRDLPLLRALKVNTIRTWSPLPDATLLDALYNNGVDPIYVLMGFWVPTSGIDYANPATVTQYRNQFTVMVNQFKNHPAILGWGIGNEVNLSLTGQALADWFELADQLAEAAYVAEGPAYHPTVLVNGNMLGLGDSAARSDDVSLAFVDAWGHNLYFGDQPHCYFDYFDRLSAKPAVVTEFGIDAYDHQAGAAYPATQADYVTRQWRWIEPRAAGGMAFEFSDEWWKASSPTAHDSGGFATNTQPDGYSNEEWWGLLSAQDNGAGPDVLNPRAAYDALSVEFAFAPGDVDADGDADLADVAGFQICRGRPAAGACGSAFEVVVDGIITMADWPAAAGRLAAAGPEGP